MQAIIQEKYGSPQDLELREIPKPVPAADEVLIKIHAASVNRSDWEILIGKPLYARIAGLFRPGTRIPGSDIAGRVEAIGNEIKEFQPGDAVFGDIMAHMGGFAEYVCVQEKYLARKPAGLTFEQAAAIPQAGVIALQAIRDQAQARPGQHILINGAGGSTGTFALQLAKLYGAQVTAVDNAGKMEFLRALGADHVMDYLQQDFTRAGKQYDFILDVIAHRSPFDYARALKPNGSCFLVGGSTRTILASFLFASRLKKDGNKQVRLLLVQSNRERLLAITELCESGKIVPMIGQRYPLREVPEALRSLGAGEPHGKIVITFQGADEK